jgi:hypothetical protein
MKHFTQILLFALVLAGSTSTQFTGDSGDGSEPVPSCWPGDTSCKPPIPPAQLTPRK